ncbi:MAG: threonine synthase [Parvularculaceae bacterium]
MEYVSTRGIAPKVQFDAALLAGLAPDGGLYLPVSWPTISADFADMPFAEAAAVILEPFVTPWLDRKALLGMTTKAFSSFSHKDVAPLRQIDDEDWLLELFHGPTLAFKDVAMQLLGVFFDHALSQTGKRATVIGATSGDTGGAAIEAFKGRDQADVFILHPKGRVSDVQRLMMTTVEDRNVHNIAIEGTFDDCQRIVKTLFADRAFADRVGLTGVNSINWARLAIQTVYYFTSLAALKKQTGASAASFSVPTGNFGDIFAGYAAKRMGAGVAKLCVAVNRNDILHRTLTTGRYEPQGVSPTTSPSMDIQVASNFERLLFEASGRDAGAVRALMESFDKKGAYEMPAGWLAKIHEDFISERVSEEEDAATIAEVEKRLSMLIDPHTAVGYAAAKKARSSGALSGPIITLATAHPAKFPDAVIAAAGKKPELPARFATLFDLPERYETAPATIDAVREIILRDARAGK